MSTYALGPIEDEEPLSTDEILTRMRREFELVESDEDAGRDQASAIRDKLLLLNAPETVIDLYRRNSSQAVMVHFGDTNPDAKLLDFLLMPGEGIQLHCEAGEVPLAKRLAAILNYEIEDIG